MPLMTKPACYGTWVVLSCGKSGAGLSHRGQSKNPPPHPALIRLAERLARNAQPASRTITRDHGPAFVGRTRLRAQQDFDALFAFASVFAFEAD
jgi:hypothetical protein